MSINVVLAGIGMEKLKGGGVIMGQLALSKGPAKDGDSLPLTRS